MLLRRWPAPRAEARLARRGRCRGTAAAALAALLLAGCAPAPLLTYDQRRPPEVLANLADAGVVDLRARFRTAVCARVDPAQRPCSEVLIRLPGEPDAIVGPATDLRPLAARYRIGFVPGLFSECVEAYARPFADAMEQLAQQDFAVELLRVAGRGSAGENAERLAGQLDVLADDPRPWILFAFSKGLVDVLEMLLLHPAIAGRVVAVVGVAGVAAGSPLAEDLSGFYGAVGTRFPLPDCAPGTGGEIEALTRTVRLEWWAKNRAKIRTPVFAIVAMARPDSVSPVIASDHRRLAQIDARNDGRLLWTDQVAPGGHLLGYVDADHLTIANPVGREWPELAFLFRDHVPRAAIVAGAIDVVAAELGLRPPARP